MFIFKSINLCLLLLIILADLVFCSIIKIPFKISKQQTSPSEDKENQIDNMIFFVKLISNIELGKPLQKIEAIFDLRISNFYISNYCFNCRDIYTFNESSSFSKVQTDKIPDAIGNNFYAYETFYFNDGNNNNLQKEVKDMLIYLPELNDKKNCLTIGLKFPDNINNNFQESFIQQLKHKNIINQYFWTMIFNDNNNLNKDNDYDGEFIFGDILNDYYPYIKDIKEYNSNRIMHTYTGNKKKKKFLNTNYGLGLEWGITFDNIYYEYKSKSYSKLNKNNNIVNINNLLTEFDFNLNIIYGTYEYSRNIQRDFFNLYFIKNICQPTHMRGSMYKYIYCFANNFTQNDLEKFPTLYFKNKDLRYLFSLDYKDLFYLTEDKKYYIFNIMTINIFNYDAIDEDELDGAKWILGLPFWKKYQFTFDSDNKLIYFYNIYGKFLDETDNDVLPNDKYNEIKSINNHDNINNTELTNNKRIINDNKNDIKNKYISIEIKKIILFIILIFIFIFIFCILILIIKKILFKKGFILIRAKKANELNENDYYEYSSQNINYSKKNNLNNNEKECEMQIKQLN